MTTIKTNYKFSPGNVGMTPTIAEFFYDPNFYRFALLLIKSVERHLLSDWGECCQEDKKKNDDALRNGDRLFSVYEIPEKLKMGEDKFWIITEANRANTTILFPSDY